MENGNNKVFIVIIVILGLMVIGLGSYLIYENKDLKCETDEKKSSTTTTETTEKESTTTPKENVNSTTSYNNYLKNLKTNLKKACDQLSTPEEEDGVICEGQSITGYGKFLENFYFDISKDGKLTMSGSSKNLKNYFISDSVLEAFISDSGGNGGYQLLYFIKEDGTLNQFCIDCIVNDDEKIILTTEYKNIINVVSTTAGPLFIDIDGNVHV